LGLDGDALERGMHEAFGPAGSVLARLGVTSSVFLADAVDDPAPVLFNRRDEQAEDDSRFRVLGEIARGGVGVIYKGHDRDLGRDVALKVLRTEHAQNPEIFQRFIEEAQIGGQLQHPGIVPVYGLGIQPDGRPSFAMKLIKGDTLASKLEGDRSALLGVFEQIAQTVAYAHSRGVLHRDLKPANVMVGSFGEVQVVDWGMAKVMGQETAQPQPAKQTVIATVRTLDEGSQSIVGSVMGTPAYMAPEQALGQVDDLDERADVFSLGAILCEILTGLPPYTGEMRDQLLAATQCKTDEALQRLEECGAHEELKQLTRDCLSGLRKDRPKDAGVVAERVAAHLAAVEERARQAEVDEIEQTARLAAEDRKKRLTRLVAAIALVAVTLGGGGAWYWQQDKQQRYDAAQPGVMAALRAAENHAGAEEWDAALGELKKADALAETVPGLSATVVERAVVIRSAADVAFAAAERDRTDRQFLAELEEATLGYGSVELAELIQQVNVIAREQFGRDPAAQELVSHFRGSPVEHELVGAFEHWAYLLRSNKNKNADFWQWVAQDLDTSPERRQVREMSYARDRDGILAWIDGHGVDALGPRFCVTLLQQPLRTLPIEKRAALFEEFRRRWPADFWLALGHAHLYFNGSAGSGAWDEAIGPLTVAVSLRPGSAGVRNTLANVLARLDRPAEAVGHLMAALQNPPVHWHVRASLVTYLIEIGRVQAADVQARAFEAVAESREARQYSAWAMGETRRALRRYKEALNWSRRARERGSDHPNVVKLEVDALLGAGQSEDAIDAAVRYVKERPDDSYVVGTLLRVLGKPPAAEHVPQLESIAGREGLLLEVRAEAAYLLGLALHRADPARARTALEDAIRLCDEFDREGGQYAGIFRPRIVRAYAIGQLSGYAPNRKEQQALLRHAVRLYPDYAWALSCLALDLARSGQERAKAEEYAKRALELSPDDAGIRGNAMLTQAFLAANPRERVAVLKKACVVLSNNPTLRAELGVSLRALGEYGQARAALGVALRIYPTYPFAHWELGRLNIAEGRLREAVSCFLRSQPTYQHAAANNVDFLLRQMGEFAERVERAEAWAQANPERADARLRLADAYRCMQRVQDAKREVHAALQLPGVDHDGAHFILFSLGANRGDAAACAKYLPLAPGVPDPERRRYRRILALLGDDTVQLEDPAVSDASELSCRAEAAAFRRDFRASLHLQIRSQKAGGIDPQALAYSAVLAGDLGVARRSFRMALAAAEEAGDARGIGWWQHDPDLAVVRDGDDVTAEWKQFWKDAEAARLRVVESKKKVRK